MYTLKLMLYLYVFAFRTRRNQGTKDVAETVAFVEDRQRKARVAMRVEMKTKAKRKLRNAKKKLTETQVQKLKEL